MAEFSSRYKLVLNVQSRRGADAIREALEGLWGNLQGVLTQRYPIGLALIDYAVKVDARDSTHFHVKAKLELSFDLADDEDTTLERSHGLFVVHKAQAVSVVEGIPTTRVDLTHYDLPGGESVDE